MLKQLFDLTGGDAPAYFEVLYIIDELNKEGLNPKEIENLLGWLYARTGVDLRGAEPAAIAAAGGEVVGERRTEATADEQKYWYDIQDKYDGYKIDLKVMGKTPGIRKECVEVIARTFKSKGVNAKMIAGWEKGFDRLEDYAGARGGEAFFVANDSDFKKYPKDYWCYYRCSGDLAWALKSFQKILSTYETFRNDHYLAGRVGIVSAYRRLGTDVVNDRYGDGDARDTSGATHWRGRAVDVSTTIPDRIYQVESKGYAELDADLAKAGLERTIRGQAEYRERNHWGIRL